MITTIVWKITMVMTRMIKMMMISNMSAVTVAVIDVGLIVSVGVVIVSVGTVNVVVFVSLV